MSKPLLIAEVKTKSPFGFETKEDHDVLLALAAFHGDVISIHTDERWGGSFAKLHDVASRSGRPIMAKGIHASDDEIKKAIDCGAWKVLVVGRLPHHSLLPHCILETDAVIQVREWAGLGVDVVWNRRDLVTGHMKPQYSLHNALDYAKECGIKLILASKFKSWDEVPEEAAAVIVGENLREFVETLPSSRYGTSQQ